MVKEGSSTLFLHSVHCAQLLARFFTNATSGLNSVHAYTCPKTRQEIYPPSDTDIGLIIIEIRT